MKQLPDLRFSQLVNISFGFFGVQIAYALQSANISRIFATLGADPHNLSYFWILPPLMGMIVQPLIGVWSDKTWCRFGRRIPYLFIGALIAVLVMCMLPNAGSFGLTVGAAMVFGLISLMLLDTSINVAMQPFKMMVGDMVNEKQKTTAYSIQSFLCNAGSLVGFVFPFVLAYIGIKKTAPDGVVPDSVIYSFYGGALILILCVLYTTLKVKEYPPHVYAEEKSEKVVEEKSEGIISLLKNAPSVFWTVGLVQFFCWAAFMYLWTYGIGTVANGIFDVPTIMREGKVVLDTTSEAYQAAGDWNGILTAIQGIGAMIWATILPRFSSKRFAYCISLIIGGLGFAGLALIDSNPLVIGSLVIPAKYVAFLPFLMQGAAWAAMLALPFTLLTNALKGGKNMGTYLGLFNCTICLPQIVAATFGGLILGLFTTPGELAPEVNMLVLAGILLIAGSATVWMIKEK